MRRIGGANFFAQLAAKCFRARLQPGRGAGNDESGISCRSLMPLEMRAAGKIIDDEKKDDARDEIDAQRMNVAHPFALDEVDRETPRLSEKKPEGLEEALVEIKESIGRIEEEGAKGAPVVDRRLATLCAIRAAQWCATILAMSQRGARFFTRPFGAAPTAQLGRGSVAENEWRRLVGHGRRLSQPGRSSPTANQRARLLA